ncbi:MAG: plasmid pRiA4b ORF-3 family protein [Roseburia faecis]
MAGIVIKIVIEDTHPPVWRRVVVPEHISFYDLHQVIQTVFEWEDAHMHIFEAPKDRFEIVTNARDAYTDYFLEEKISVSAIAERESWVRYVYDMGDDWRHKLTFEKRMEDYDKNYALLWKAKGNSFTEDSGGIWDGEQMTGYDAASINQQLEQMHFKEVVPSKKDQQKLEQIYMMQNLQKKVQELVRQSMERRKEKRWNRIIGNLHWNQQHRKLIKNYWHGGIFAGKMKRDLSAK